MKVRSHSPWTRRIAVAAMTVAAVGLLYGAYRVLDRPCTRLDLRGVSQADTTSVLRLAMLADSTLEASIVADRVRRHPWVRWSRATCYPNRVLQLSIEERVPVLLVVDEAGAATHFIDSAGFMMPVTGQSRFDVPLLRDFREPYHPIRPVAHPQVRMLAQHLMRLDAGTERLLSEFRVTPQGMKLYTVPARSGEPVEVWLGRSDFDLRLQWLRSFWNQRVESHPGRIFHMIDVRFEG